MAESAKPNYRPMDRWKPKTINKPSITTLKPDDRYDTFDNAAARAAQPIAEAELPEIDPVTVTIGELEIVRNRIDSERLAAHQVKLAEIEAAIVASDDALEALGEAAAKATKRLEEVSQEIERGLNELGMTKDNCCRRHTPTQTKEILWQRRIKESPRWMEVNDELTACKTYRSSVLGTKDRLEHQKGEVRRGIDKIVGSYFKNPSVEKDAKSDLFTEPQFRNE